MAPVVLPCLSVGCGCVSFQKPRDFPGKSRDGEMLMGLHLVYGLGLGSVWEEEGRGSLVAK